MKTELKILGKLLKFEKRQGEKKPYALISIAVSYSKKIGDAWMNEDDWYNAIVFTEYLIERCETYMKGGVLATMEVRSKEGRLNLTLKDIELTHRIRPKLEKDEHNEKDEHKQEQSIEDEIDSKDLPF